MYYIIIILLCVIMYIRQECSMIPKIQWIHLLLSANIIKFAQSVVTFYLCGWSKYVSVNPKWTRTKMQQCTFVFALVQTKRRYKHTHKTSNCSKLLHLLYRSMTVFKYLIKKYMMCIFILAYVFAFISICILDLEKWSVLLKLLIAYFS